MTRWTEEDLAAARKRMADKHLEGRPQQEKRSKYGNVRVNWQGQSFDSKHELKVYRDLELQRASGRIRALIRQVSMPLPHTQRRARIDFLVIENDGGYRWCDAKGFETAMSKFKRQQLLDAYSITVELI